MVTFYEIRIEGMLPQDWSDWFGGMGITQFVDGETALSGPVADQAALHGLLNLIRDLNLKLVSVERIAQRQP